MPHRDYLVPLDAIQVVPRCAQVRHNRARSAASAASRSCSVAWRPARPCRRGRLRDQPLLHGPWTPGQGLDLLQRHPGGDARSRRSSSRRRSCFGPKSALSSGNGVFQKTRRGGTRDSSRGPVRQKGHLDQLDRASACRRESAREAGRAAPLLPLLFRCRPRPCRPPRAPAERRQRLARPGAGPDAARRHHLAVNATSPPRQTQSVPALPATVSRDRWLNRRQTKVTELSCPDGAAARREGRRPCAVRCPGRPAVRSGSRPATSSRAGSRLPAGRSRPSPGRAPPAAARSGSGPAAGAASS